MFIEYKYFIDKYTYIGGGASKMVLVVKNPPTNAGDTRETQVWSLGWEDPLEEGMATHSSILTWRIPWTEESDRLQSIQSQTVGQAGTYAYIYIFICIYTKNAL